jgi:putative copper export protein/mono/diheme cytochrome c family protein
MNDAFVAVRIVHIGAAMLVFGELVFAVFVATPRWRNAVRVGVCHALDRHVMLMVTAALAAGALSGVAWLVIEAGQMAGASIGQVLRDATVVVVLRDTEFGHVFALRAVLWLALAASLGWLQAAHDPGAARVRRAVALIVAAAYLGTLAGAGHAAGAEAGALRFFHLGADAGHLLAAGGWLGALPPLVVGLARVEDEAAARLARRFSVLGLVCVGVLIASGIVNTLFLVGTLPALVGTPYGRLLVVKLALFGVMLAIAAINRFRWTPRLREDDAARRSLRRNAIVEIAIGAAIVAIVGALGTMVPGAHESPRWPFPYTLDLSIEPHGVDRAIFASSVAFGGAAIALVIAGLLRRATRLWLPGSIVLVLAAAAAMFPFAAPALPTMYASSPVPYTVDAVAAGAVAFRDHCAACHGAGGHGDGAAAARLPVKPTNVAEHALHHRPGNLFWWIAHGIAGTPMPAFSPQLSDTAIWQVVQYLTALANAEAAAQVGPRVDAASTIRVPDFSYELAGREQQTLGGVPQPALVVLGSDASQARIAELAQDHRLVHAPLRVIPVASGGAPADVNPDVAQVYAIFARTSNGREAAHAELLIDAAGILRARWLGLPAGDLDRDAEIAAALARLPAAPAARAPSHHGH